MNPLHINGFGLSAALAIIACGAGCSESYPPVECSSAGSGGTSSGGADWGLSCLWAESRGDLSFPVCPSPLSSEFMGIIDGKPYDIKDRGKITGMAPPSHPPYTLSININGTGSLDLEWTNPYVRGQWMSVATGVIVLPEDGKPRTVDRSSQLLMDCEDYSFLYILHVEGGDLTGCSR